jgi:Flp pilus assembly protein TadD
MGIRTATPRLPNYTLAEEHSSSSSRLRQQSPRSVLSCAALALVLASCSAAHAGVTTTAVAPFSALVGAGNVLLHRGNFNAAEQVFEQATKAYPTDPIGYYDLGVAYQQAGESQAALDSYRQALKFDPKDVSALYNSAVIYATYPLGAQQAIFTYRQILTIQPDSPTAYLNLGLLEWRVRGGQHDAVRFIDKAIILDPSLAKRIPPDIRAAMATAGRSTTKHGKSHQEPSVNTNGPIATTAGEAR